MLHSPARAAVSLSLTLALAGLAGCSGGSQDTAPGEQATGAEGTRAVETPRGEVEVPTDPQKVVVLNYALAGYLYDLDVPVAATIPEDAEQVEGEYSEFWGDAPQEDDTRFLPWSADGFDLEAILGAEPDLIIAGGWGFPHFQADEAYDDLSAIAPTVMVDLGFADWQEQLEFLAVDVFDDQEAYDMMVADYDARVEEVRDAIEVPQQPTSFVSVTADGTPYLVLEDTGLPAMADQLGFETAALGEEHSLEPYQPGGDLAELSTEQLGQIVDSETVFVLGFNADTTSVEELAEEPAWSALPAFQGDRAYDLPYWALRHDFDEAMALLDSLEEEFAG